MVQIFGQSLPKRHSSVMTKIAVWRTKALIGNKVDFGMATDLSYDPKVAELHQLGRPKTQYYFLTNRSFKHKLERQVKPYSLSQLSHLANTMRSGRTCLFKYHKLSDTATQLLNQYRSWNLPIFQELQRRHTKAFRYSTEIFVFVRINSKLFFLLFYFMFFPLKAEIQTASYTGVCNLLREAELYSLTSDLFHLPSFGDKKKKKKNHRPAWLVNMSVLRAAYWRHDIWEVETVTARPSLDLPTCRQSQWRTKSSTSRGIIDHGCEHLQLQQDVRDSLSWLSDT